jgi:hypothetical protein
MPLNSTKKRSIYDQLDLEGIADLLLESSPFPINLLTFPYNLVRYGNILKKSYTLDDVYEKHSREATKSIVFALLSPNYYKVRRSLLQKHEIL